MTGTPPTPDELARHVRGESSPAGDDEGSVDFGIRIARDGTWYHLGTPFRRPALVKLFSTVMRKAEDGKYLLVTPVERGRICVDDAPFVAVEMKVEGDGRDRRIHLRTNIDEWVRVDAEHPLWTRTDPKTGEPSPYVMVHPDRGLEALIARSIFYDLVELAEEDEGTGDFVVWAEGERFPIGSLQDGA